MTSAYAATSTYSCTGGDTLNGTTCTRTTTTAATPSYSCPNGAAPSNGQCTGTNSTSTAYIYLAGKQIAETVVGGATQYVHTDALGSPVAHTNQAGAETSRTKFEPYGYTAGGTKPGPAMAGVPTTGSAIGFTGHVNDPETDLVYMQQRYYDPVAGRFLSVDPVVTNTNNGSSFNRYMYANNNPYLNIDPDGRSSKVATLVRLTANGMKSVARLTKEQAIAARRAGENVRGDRKKISKQIESAAHGTEDQLKHKGHDLPDGSIGLPHYQTDGKLGHTFWGIVAGLFAVGADALSNTADALELIDPMTHLSSGNSYVGVDGRTVTYDELIKKMEEKQRGPKVQEEMKKKE